MYHATLNEHIFNGCKLIILIENLQDIIRTIRHHNNYDP